MAGLLDSDPDDEYDGPKAGLLYRPAPRTGLLGDPIPSAPLGSALDRYFEAKGMTSPLSSDPLLDVPRYRPVGYTYFSDSASASPAPASAPDIGDITVRGRAMTPAETTLDPRIGQRAQAVYGETASLRPSITVAFFV